MSEIKLLSCPFCGGRAEIQLTDNGGEWKGKDYLKNPVNGIGYVITHPSVPKCPIAASGERVGRWIYESEEAAAKMWNRRAGFNE
ncbi:MAG TPA: Lar family restriction alleviation protein [Candidatus Blautia faecavium]|uniref:Lar family restriction alleviation protein n=1 Tax=Candidatus Blautia faecavium TaxID=2838487 RepID=A0A9D2LSE6_9FIRM|nr:Lar family restriction alleviation protein [Candidatus Blautia faecavium]